MIGVSVSAALFGFCGVFREPVQKRLHPISQSRIMTGRRVRMTALLRTFMFLGRFKTMPDVNFAG